MQSTLPSATARRSSARGVPASSSKAYIVSVDRALVAAARRIFVCAGIPVSVCKDLDEYLTITDPVGRRSGYAVIDVRGETGRAAATAQLARLEGHGGRVLVVASATAKSGATIASLPTVRVAGDYAPVSAALQSWLAGRTAPSHEAAPSERSRQLRIDDSAHEVYVGESRLPLRPTEHALLRFFLERPHQLLSRADLLRLLWGEQTSVELRTVDVHVMRLRKALRPYGLEGFIETVFGFGYRANHDVLDRPIEGRTQSPSVSPST
jgi:DNA-binding response OmpR family regulator